jgi:hypothetical protein
MTRRKAASQALENGTLWPGSARWPNVPRTHTLRYPVANPGADFR